ncbi:hypothetical protein [Acinetobacter sp. UBA6720]|uniref:hypothetical protein n=1 Tax=Acinetobacter sp. UBA6720 TaxID=1945953 RepID=UPI0025BABAE1|nr:hypothetical protein [Acinetobacter sp. UBA6720]
MSKLETGLIEIQINEFIYDGENIVVGDENWKEWVLSSDPFEGDIGDGNNLTDKIVKTRQTKQLCSDCLSICEPNKYSRVISSAVDGQLLTNRYCQECCTAMAFDELHQDYKQYDDESEDYPEEEIMLSDVRQEVRTRNEKILIGVLGKRYFDKPNDQLFKVMIEAQEPSHD